MSYIRITYSESKHGSKLLFSFLLNINRYRGSHNSLTGKCGKVGLMWLLKSYHTVTASLHYSCRQKQLTDSPHCGVVRKKLEEESKTLHFFDIHENFRQRRLRMLKISILGLSISKFCFPERPFCKKGFLTYVI